MDREKWQNVAARRDAMGWEPWSEDERALLASYNTTAGLGEAMLERIDDLGRSDALAVVAGQQAGLFLAPLYIVHKALGAVLWARRLEDALGRPVVPIFWIASDDHDFEEVRHAPYLTASGEVARVSYPSADADTSAFESRSVFDVPLDATAVGRLLDEIDAATHDTEFKAPRLDAWREAALASSNMEDFFARLMADTLGEQCPVLLPSRLAPLRERAMPIARRELENPCESTRRVMAAIDAARDQGEHPLLHRRGGEVNFFVYRDGVRAKVESDGDALRVVHPVSGETMEETTAGALLEELEASPDHFSPNVMTRPVVQDAALPTIAQIVGPGEMNYLGLLGDVYGLFETPAPERVLRPRALLVEPRIERHMDKIGIDDALLAREDWGAVVDAIRRDADSVGALETLDVLESDIDGAFVRASESFGDLSKRPAIGSALEKTRQNIAKGTEQMRRRIEQEIDREQARAGDLEGKFRDALFPEDQPQERVLGPLAPFLTHYGPGFARWLAEGLDVEKDGVQVLRMSGVETE